MFLAKFLLNQPHLVGEKLSRDQMDIYDGPQL